MREISCNTGGVDHIVKSKLVNQRAGFQEERKRLRIRERRVLSAMARHEKSPGGGWRGKGTNLANSARCSKNS